MQISPAGSKIPENQNMSTIHRCPENILRMFDEGNKQQGMQEVLDWLQIIVMVKGDVVLMPNPNTGELVSYIFDPEKVIN